MGSPFAKHGRCVAAIRGHGSAPPQSGYGERTEPAIWSRREFPETLGAPRCLRRVYDIAHRHFPNGWGEHDPGRGRLSIVRFSRC